MREVFLPPITYTPGDEYTDMSSKTLSKDFTNGNIARHTLKASLGAFIFLAGPENVGTYGAYKDLSSIYIKVEYSF